VHVVRRWINLAESYITKKDPQAVLDWFGQHGFQRVLNFARRLGPAQAAND